MERVLQNHPYLDGWRTLSSEYPAQADLASRLRFLINYAVLAPSPYNSQPWRFEVEGDGVRLYADYTRSRPVADPDGRELVMSCGAALLHLRLAVRFFGLQYALYLNPDAAQPDYLAFLQVSGQSAPLHSEVELFRAIPRRHTHRGEFAPQPIGAGLVRRLREAAGSEGAYLRVMNAGGEQDRVLTIAWEAERARWESPRFCREWAGWVRRDDHSAADGLPANVLGLSPALVPWLPLMMRAMPAGRVPGQSGGLEALAAPSVACVETASDGVLDWLQAGQALERLLLTAGEDGVLASFLSHPIQVPEYRDALRELLRTARNPQALLRMGYRQGDPATPRHTVDEVVTSF